MDFRSLFDLFFHLDKYLGFIINAYPAWSYALLFVVIFMETGVVITPFLPGDSLLFAAGALSAGGSFNIIVLLVVLYFAAFLGDTCNYWIGYYIGPKAFTGNSRFFKKEYLHKAHLFYEKHGGIAIILARYVPIVRTFAPFVAGISKMDYRKFLSYNIIGGVAWVSMFTLSGFLFGNIPFIKENFEYVAIIIILISVVPIGYELLHDWRSHKTKVAV
jgi:membrane-associated protein